MRPSVLALASAFGISSSAARAATDAMPVSGNSPGKTFTAVLPDEPFTKASSVNGNVKGSLTATSGPGGKGVDYTVEFSNLPKEGGPFTYHIHVDPVPEDGNCTKTLAHLDPFARGEEPSCDSSKPGSCQVGDLSGKYGKIPVGQDSYSKTFHDDFASMEDGVGSYFGNRSFVFHFANKTRITCANFAPLESDEDCEDDDSDNGGAAPTYDNGTITSVTSALGGLATGTGSPNSAVGGNSTFALPTATPVKPDVMSSPTATVPVAAANALGVARDALLLAPLAAALFL